MYKPNFQISMPNKVQCDFENKTNRFLIFYFFFFATTHSFHKTYKQEKLNVGGRSRITKQIQACRFKKKVFLNF